MELLELYLSPLDGRRFKAIATRKPEGVGDAETECELPFWVGEQDWRTTVIKVLEGDRGFQSSHFPGAEEQDWLVGQGLLRPDRQTFDPAYLQRMGQALYRSLFPPDSATKTALQQSLRRVEQRQTDLHLRLKFSADSGQRSRLADYPWELLQDGQRFLLHQQLRLSRYIAYESVPPQVAAQETIQVLLVSARPQGLPQLSQAEQEAVREGLLRAEQAGRVQVQVLAKATERELSRYLTDCLPEQRPQVLHFDGHGVFGKRCEVCQTVYSGMRAASCDRCKQALLPPQGYLAFETEQGQPDYRSAQQVAAVLQPYALALVVLSACQSGMAVAGDSVFNGMAQNLIDQRIPAVVAMQYSVRVGAAREFAEQFYRVLGNREPLLRAVNLGRRAMDVEGDQWYRPVLYLRWADEKGGQLFADTTSGAEVERSPEPPPPASSVKRAFCERQIAQLQERLAAVETDLESVDREEARMGLEKRAEVLLNKISQLQAQLDLL